MPSYWERKAEEKRRRVLSQAAGVPLPSLGSREGLAAQAEARVNQARVDRLVRAVGAKPGFALPSGALGPGFEPRPEDYAAAGQMVSDVLIGPERESWVSSGEAGGLERFVRDWGLSEQEFRLSGQRAAEGRAGAAAGWGLLGLAGAVPFFGDIAQGVGKVARAAGSAADVGRAAPPIQVTERGIPTQPQTGKSILEDATPGLADGDAIVRGVDEAFRLRGQESPWVPGEKVDFFTPGISIGRVANYDSPYFLKDVESVGGRPWRDAVGIIKNMQNEVVAIDRSYYSVDNRKMLELFEQAANSNDWSRVPSPNVYDPLGYGTGSWFDSPDANSINAFVESLYARALSQAYSNNALIQQRMLRSISEIDEAQRARELIAIERARFSYVSDLMQDANPMIQTDAYLFDSRISRKGFMNQFQTGTSNGDLDFYSRVIAESAMLGIPPQLGATHRPVYGYVGRVPARGSADIGAEVTTRLTDSIEGIGVVARRIMSPNQAWLEQYGDISVVFDRSKLSDATFTVGDSLGAASQGKVVASNAGNVTPDSLLIGTAESLSPSSRFYAARYFELQYINPSLEDVIAIYMKNDGPYRTVLDALRRAGLSDVEIIVGAK